MRFPDMYARDTRTIHVYPRGTARGSLKSPYKSGPDLAITAPVMPRRNTEGGIPTVAGSSMTMTRADSLSKHAVVNVCSRFMPDVTASP